MPNVSPAQTLAKRAALGAGLIGAAALLASLGGPATAGAASGPPARAALCGTGPGRVGEYDGYTTQGKAVGPNGTPLPARRVWIYREGRADCRVVIFFVYEWRDGRKPAQAASCPLNTVKGAFIANGYFAPENIHGEAAFSRRWRYKGFWYDSLFTAVFPSKNPNLVRGGVGASYGPSPSKYTCLTAVSVFYTAKWRPGTSPIFSKGGQGYAIKRDYDTRNPVKLPETCQVDDQGNQICSVSQP
jgi:hypothetical protein